LSARDLQRLRRERWTGDRAVQPRLMRGIGQHLVEVVRMDRHHELELRTVLLAACFGGRIVVVEDGRREVAAHRFGEFKSGWHGVPPDPTASTGKMELATKARSRNGQITAALH